MGQLPDRRKNRRDFGIALFACLTFPHVQSSKVVARVDDFEFHDIPFEATSLEIVGANSVANSYTSVRPNFGEALEREINRVSGITISQQDIVNLDRVNSAGLFCVYIMSENRWRKFRLWNYSSDCVPDYPVTTAN